MDIHPPFSEQEKRFVLAEAIKLSSIPVDRLLAVLSESNVQPAWSQMLLPYGRNLQSCIDTFEVLRAAHGQPSPYSALPLPNPSHKRKSGPESLEPLMTGPQPKRRQSGVETTVPSARDIRPKPTSSNGSPHPFSALPGQPAAPAKKRGRPSKADVEERNREAIARGEVLPPPKAMTPKGGRQPVTGEPSSAGYAAIAPMGTAPPEQGGGVQYQSGPVEGGMTATVAPAAPGDSPGKKKRARAAPRPKVPKPGESSFSITTPQMTLPQPVEAPQVQTPITPSQAFAQHRPIESVPISQLVQPTEPESQGQPPPVPPSQPEPSQPGP